jgi:hypothetical protein
MYISTLFKLDHHFKISNKWSSLQKEIPSNFVHKSLKESILPTNLCNEKGASAKKMA